MDAVPTQAEIGRLTASLKKDPLQVKKTLTHSIWGKILLGLFLVSGLAAHVSLSPAAGGQGKSRFDYIGYGANRCVSGSLHVVTIDGDRLILDAGAFYANDGKNAPPLPPDLVEGVSAAILSHVHLDHAGRLPDIIKMGYKGPILCSKVTKELLQVMLLMSARLADRGKEKFYYSRNTYYRNRREGKPVCVHCNPECPWGKKIKFRGYAHCARPELEKYGYYLCQECIEDEIYSVLRQVYPVTFNKKYRISPKLVAEFFHTPHLPGSVMVRVSNPSTEKSLLFTGDYGSGLSPYLKEQEYVDSATWVIVEGTYGPRISSRQGETREDFQKFIGKCVREGKRVIIPAFVLDRTQQVLGEIAKGRRAGYIPKDRKVKVYGGSALEINDLYSYLFVDKEYSNVFTDTFRIQKPFDEIYTIPMGSSQEILHKDIAVCSPGMANAGYAKEFVERYVSDPDTVFIFVGYQSPATIGGKLTRLPEKEDILALYDDTVLVGKVVHEDARKLTIETDEGRRSIFKSRIRERKQPAPIIVIDGIAYPVKAQVRKFGCFSGHGKPDQIKEFLSRIRGLKRVLLVHSDSQVVDELAEYYRKNFPDVEFVIPEMGKSYSFTD